MLQLRLKPSVKVPENKFLEKKSRNWDNTTTDKVQENQQIHYFSSFKWLKNNNRHQVW
jgi:hypothetical protein